MSWDSGESVYSTYPWGDLVHPGELDVVKGRHARGLALYPPNRTQTIAFFLIGASAAVQLHIPPLPAGVENGIGMDVCVVIGKVGPPAGPHTPSARIYPDNR